MTYTDDKITRTTTRGRAQLLRTPPLRIACVGDSLTSGVGHASVNWPTRLARNTGHVVTSFAVSGNKSAAILAQWANNVDGNGYDVVICLGGVNDVIAGDSVATAASNLLAIGVGDPARVVTIGVLPFGDYAFSANHDNDTDALNALLSSGAAEYWDPRAYFGTGAAGWYLEPSWTDDGLHLDDEGSEAMALWVARLLTDGV